HPPLPGRSHTRAERACPPARPSCNASTLPGPCRFPRERGAALRPRAVGGSTLLYATAPRGLAGPREALDTLLLRFDPALLTRMWDLSYTERRDRLALPLPRGRDARAGSIPPCRKMPAWRWGGASTALSWSSADRGALPARGRGGRAVRARTARAR